jgi:hypothetical protein
MFRHAGDMGNNGSDTSRIGSESGGSDGGIGDWSSTWMAGRGKGGGGGDERSGSVRDRGLGALSHPPYLSAAQPHTITSLPFLCVWLEVVWMLVVKEQLQDMEQVEQVLIPRGAAVLRASFTMAGCIMGESLVVVLGRK